MSVQKAVEHCISMVFLVFGHLKFRETHYLAHQTNLINWVFASREKSYSGYFQHPKLQIYSSQIGYIHRLVTIQQINFWTASQTVFMGILEFLVSVGIIKYL
uniref:Uncharacterized protein n=1 Tax=Micrurus carvalhoi TaxID=3147026 RepID=A0A2H6NA93_9SAUR